MFVDSTDVLILDATSKCLRAQLVPDWPRIHAEKKERKNPFEDTPFSASSRGSSHKLYWEAKVPPLGLTTFFLGRPADFTFCAAADLSEIEVVNAPKDFDCPKPYQCNKREAVSSDGADPEDFSIGNRELDVEFDPLTGLIREVEVSEAVSFLSLIGWCAARSRFRGSKHPVEWVHTGFSHLRLR